MGEGTNNVVITDMKVKKLKNFGRLLGDASITLNGCLVIHNIQIVQLDEKRILSFPHKSLSNGRIVDMVHPINNELRTYIEDKVFKMFDELDEVSK